MIDIMTYDDLLRVFWEGHDPTQGMRQGNDLGTQYRSAVYTLNDAQQTAAPPLCFNVANVSERRRHPEFPAFAAIRMTNAQFLCM